MWSLRLYFDVLLLPVTRGEQLAARSPKSVVRVNPSTVLFARAPVLGLCFFVSVERGDIQITDLMTDSGCTRPRATGAAAATNSVCCMRKQVGRGEHISGFRVSRGRGG